MTGAPEWSVVIPTFNRLSALKEVIEALHGQEGPPFEVIVVNDGSSDGTADWLDRRAASSADDGSGHDGSGQRGGRSPQPASPRSRPPRRSRRSSGSPPQATAGDRRREDGRRPELAPVQAAGSDSLRVLHQPNRGPAVARNRGVAEARGRWVAFLGDDTVPAPGWLAAHARAHASDVAREIRSAGGCVGVIGRTDWHPRMRRTPFLDYINEHGLQFGFALIEDRDDVPFNFFYTSNLSVDREALAAEPFDPAFPYAAWEDVEAGYRLAASHGLRLLYRPAARVAHDHPTDLARFAQRQYRSGYSAVVFFRRHEQLGPFLGMQNGGPPPAGGARERALLWAQERLARVLQGMPFRLPRLWENAMRHHYLEGLRDGWADGVGLDRGGAP